MRNYQQQLRRSNEMVRRAHLDENKAVLSAIKQYPKGALIDEISQYTLIKPRVVETTLHKLQCYGHVQNIGRRWFIS